jgi:putative FmdB family regulatory protein
MPTYSYFCLTCEKDFELFSYISAYQENPKCIICKNKNTNRLYGKDVLTQACSIKKSDSELNTLGDLANRNRDKMSDDQKRSLTEKHNLYKNEEAKKELPSGMTRLKKQPKTKWS